MENRQLSGTFSEPPHPAADRTHEDERRSPGAAILAQARELGADLLVKGAYTQSRIRQMIFGGPTQHILERADVPVLMAH